MLNATLAGLLGFAGWTLLLVAVLLFYRTFLVFTLQKRANAWPRDGAPPADQPGFFTRVGHAHQNCIENLPVFAAIVLVAYMAGALEVTDRVAMWVLYARIAQTMTHLVGTSHWLVFVRANFFAVQLLLFGYMIWGILR